MAVSAAVLVVGVAQIVVPLDPLRYACASVLILFGLYKLLRRKHPRWVGMRVGFKDLTAWSFLMASAHGAGLMLVPVVLKLSSSAEPMQEMDGHADHAAHAAGPFCPTSPIAPVRYVCLLTRRTEAMHHSGYEFPRRPLLGSS